MALEIIGPGFGRTGTHSLKLALERLGFGPCHHMFEVRDDPGQLPAWQAAACGEPVDWDAVFAGYRAQVDWPGARYWRALARHYPDAKAILTVRDPDGWFDSVQATLAPLVASRGTHASPHLNAVIEMGYRTVVQPLFQGRMSERAHATRVFLDHVASVRAALPADRLLVLDVREGWAPLCRFLGVAEPAEPFPWTNSSRQFAADRDWQG